MPSCKQALVAKCSQELPRIPQNDNMCFALLPFSNVHTSAETINWISKEQKTQEATNTTHLREQGKSQPAQPTPSKGFQGTRHSPPARQKHTGPRRGGTDQEQGTSFEQPSTLSDSTRSRAAPQGTAGQGLWVTTAQAEPSPTWGIQQHPRQDRLQTATGIPRAQPSPGNV